MRTITKTELIIRLVFLISIIAGGLMAAVSADEKIEQKVFAQQKAVTMPISFKR